MANTKRSNALRLFLAFSCLSLVSRATIAAPRITNLPIRGLQAGGAVTLTVQGSDLLPEPKLLIDAPIVKQELIEAGSTSSQLQIRVTLDAKATAGLYNLRLANRLGVSNTIVVAIDTLPQSPLADRIPSTPIALHGALAGSNIARTALAGKKGQSLIIEVESQRLGGKLRPVLHLYDKDRRQVALALPTPRLGGDARLVATLPFDGEYSIELHDLQYAAQSPGHYRLKVGEFQFADQVFPPAIQRGKETALSLLGNLTTKERPAVKGRAGETVVAAPWPKLEKASGWRPYVLVSDIPELLEQREEKDSQLLPTPPVAVSGRLDVAKQEDVYRVPVKEGDKLRFEVFAARIGSPTDIVLEVRNDKGGRLAFNDDFAPTTDSRIDYTVAKGLQSVDVVVKDQLSRGEPTCIYRLVVSPISQSPSFRLKLSEDAQSVPQGGTRVFQVLAERSGYDGPIRLKFDDLPPGVSVSGARIASGSNGALVTLHAEAGDVHSVVTSIRGASEGVTPPITAKVVNEKHPLAKIQPWLQHEVALSTADSNKLPFTADWSQPSAVTQLILGTTFRAPLKLTRPAGAIGPVRVSLVSSQPPPLVNGKPDANRSLRSEKPVLDIPIDPKAKAALDALNAATAALASATSKAKSVKESGVKQMVAVQATLKVAAEKSKSAAQVSAAMVARRKAAEAKLKAAMAELGEAETAVNQASSNLAAAQAEEKAVAKMLAELTAKVKKQSDAATAASGAAEAKQAEAEKAFRAAEASIKNVVDFNVIVPPNLTVTPQHDVALKVELRSIDNKQVLAEVFTPVRRFTPRMPLGLTLPGDPAYVAKLDAKAGATVRVRGQVERRLGFAGDVTVTVAGQPKGITAPKQVLKANQHDFELELKFPANFGQRQVDSIKIVATGPHNPKTPKVVLRSETPVSITLLPPQPAK